MSDPVIIVGSGPAGSSAALALLERGIPVLMLEAGSAKTTPPPPGQYLDLRFKDASQWHWLVGKDGEALSAAASASPKFRVPGLRSIFAGYANANQLHTSGFHLVGAMAPGGLSNAWGCGVARFNADELGVLSNDAANMDLAFERVARRMGLSGASDDALRDVTGLDAYSGPALPLDYLHSTLWERRHRLSHISDFRLGRARVAVLGADQGDRKACNQAGTCLWGCARGATWSAAFDVEQIRKHPLARVETNTRVVAVHSDGAGQWTVDAITQGEARRFRASRVMLAAGTIASTRLALAAMPTPPAGLRLQSNPMAAFLLCLPGALGRPRTADFGLAQLSFALDLPASSAFGNLFATTGLPLSEFLPHLPVSRQAGLPLLRALMPALVVGNVFLPGELSNHRLRLEPDGSLHIEGGAQTTLPAALVQARSLIARSFRKIGAWMLPGSFVPGAAGADLHYASTLPIAKHPTAFECNLSGQIDSLPGLYVVDGASLPKLPAKAHTLTIMANADRIARAIPA